MDSRKDDASFPALMAKVAAYAAASGLPFHSALAIVRAQLGLEVL